jgi:hypothetical protein
MANYRDLSFKSWALPALPPSTVTRQPRGLRPVTGLHFAWFASASGGSGHTQEDHDNLLSLTRITAAADSHGSESTTLLVSKGSRACLSQVLYQAIDSDNTNGNSLGFPKRPAGPPQRAWFKLGTQAVTISYHIVYDIRVINI